MRRIRFDDGGLLLDLDVGEVAGDDARRRLSPLSLRLLSYLVHNHGRAVPNEELLREVWDAHVSQDSLRQALRVLRRELGDAGKGLIQNVRGRGYRIAVPFSEEDRSRPDPLVGRGTELASLRRDLESARVGRGRLTLVSGPPGIGKTRLLEEVAERARASGFGTAVARCGDAEGTPSLWAWEELLRGVAEDGAELLGRLSASERAALLRAFPSLEGERRPPRPDRALDAAAARFRLFEAVGRALDLASDTRPLALVLDDLQAADATSLGVLEWLVAHLGTRRIGLFVACRDPGPETDARLREGIGRLLRSGDAYELALGPLAREAVAEAVHEKLGSEDEATIETVWRECAGNPFLLQISLERAGHRREDEAASRTFGTGTREAVLDHLELLSEPARRVLAAAAVQGVELHRELLSELLGDAEDVAGAVEEARRAGLLRERPDGRLAFVHALVVETLYEALDVAQREAFHARIGERLAARPEVDPALAAEHLFRARATLDANRVVAACEQAASAAMRRLGFEEAVRWLERALVCADEGAAPRPRLRLLVALAEARARASGARGAKAASDRAVALARALGDDRAQARAVLAFGLGRGTVSDVPDLRWRSRIEQALADHRDATPERAALLWMLAESLWLTPEVERARALVRESLELAEEVGDEDVRAGALVHAYRVLQTGRGDDALRADLAARLAATLPEVRDPLVTLEGCLTLQWHALMDGDRPDVDRWSSALLREAEAVGGPHAAWWASVSRSSRAHLQADLDEAERQAELGLALGTAAGIDSVVPNHLLEMLSIRWDQGRLPELVEPLAAGAQRDPHNTAWTLAWRMAQLHAGSPDAARELLRAVCERGLDELPANVGYAPMLAMLTHLTVRLGDERGARALREVLPAVTHRHAVVALGFCHWGAFVGHLGRVERLLGDLDAAVAHLEEALARERALGALAWIARDHVELAAALASRDAPGDRERARSLEAEGRSLAAGIEIALW